MICTRDTSSTWYTLPKGRVFFLLALSLLGGCENTKGTEDLEQFVAEIKSATAPEVEPLPIIEPVESYQYAAASEGNPFSISNVLPEKKEVPKAPPLLAELDRDREVLEFFPLDSLIMVGTLKQGDVLWAMIVAPDGTIHRVKKGNYIGSNLGEILEVVEGQIKVEETFESDDGEWEKRVVAVALPE